MPAFLLVPTPSSYPKPPTSATLPLQRLTGALPSLGSGEMANQHILDTCRCPPLVPNPKVEGYSGSMQSSVRQIKTRLMVDCIQFVCSTRSLETSYMTRPPRAIVEVSCMFGGIELGFQRCSGPYLPTGQACSTQIGSGRVLYLQRALRLGLFFVEFVAAARRHNTYISVRPGASSRYHSAPLPRSSAHALHHRSHKAFRTSAAHKRSSPIAGFVCPPAPHWS